MPAKRPITVVKGFGGRRLADGAVPKNVEDWSEWQCDPTVEGRAPTRGFAWGKSFPWHFDKEEKAFIVSGEATLTPDDPSVHCDAVKIGPRDMVTFPNGWRGRWDVHSMLKKRYAFFDGKGLRVDEADSDDEATPKTAKRKAKAKTSDQPKKAAKKA